MNTMLVKPGVKSQRAALEKLLDQHKKMVMEAYDKGESINIHSHQQIKPFGCVGLIEEFIFQGWTFGVSIGQYPMDYVRRKREKNEVTA